MRIREIEAKPGEHSFGYLKAGRTRSGISPDIPVHIFAGTEPGPTLLVQAAIHGSEMIGTMAILNYIKKLDPKAFKGNVIAVPVVNRMGFELSDRGSRLDGKDISRLFPGNPKGTVSDQVAHAYFQEVIKKANVMIDFHAGGQTAYERYVLYEAEVDVNNLTEIEKKRRKLIAAFGIDKAAFFPPGTFGTNSNTAKSAIEGLGVVQFTLEFGGGTGWHKNGLDNLRDAERGIWNTMKAMKMIEGEFEYDCPECTVYNAGVVVWKGSTDGLFIREKKFGEFVKKGEVYGSLFDPCTGKKVGELLNSKDATVIPSGQEWLTVGSTSIGILGIVDRVEDRRKMDMYVDFEERGRVEA